MIREVTNTAPIVFTSVSDPIEQDFVPSLAKPGGNTTGFTAYDFSIGGKWLGVLKQMAPDLARLAIMFNPDTSPQSNFFSRSIGAVGSSFGIAMTATPIRTTSDIEPAIENFARQPHGGLILPTDSFRPPHFEFIAGTANRHRLPSLGYLEQYVKDGGLMHYGTGINSDVETFRRAANYVDRTQGREAKRPAGAKPDQI